MKRTSGHNGRISTLVACALSVLLCSGGLSPAQVIVPGFDVYETNPGDSPPNGGPGTWLDLGGAPIPADFFEPASDPFDGQVCLQGVPFDPTFSGPTDTHVARWNPTTFPGGSESGTVETEIISLSLQSVEPITVTFNGGQNPTEWDVRVNLASPGPTAGPSTGQLNLDHSVPGPDGGGTILGDSFFDVHFEVELESRADGTVLLLGTQSDRLVLRDSVPWSHTPPNGTWILPGDMTTNFFPGATPGQPDVPPELMQFDGSELHVNIGITPEPTTLGLLALGGLALLRRKA